MVPAISCFSFLLEKCQKIIILFFLHTKLKWHQKIDNKAGLYYQVKIYKFSHIVNETADIIGVF